MLSVLPSIMAALRDAPELKPYILQKVERTGKFLGSGSFGSVEELTFDHAPCAGKKIHGSLIDSRNEGSKYLVAKFEQECKLLKELRHPHIVQFLGLYFFDDDSNVPFIVMELLDSNIEQWLIDSNDRELPLSLKSTILRDTARGLYYLHTHKPPIIHRDVTARNVLLASDMTAKIADLGNAYIVPPVHLTKTMTRVPGTIPYMPPEAFMFEIQYSEKLDMFSFGHLALYVMIQEQPYDHILPPKYFDPKNPEETLGRTEVERRKYYFDKMDTKFTHSRDNIVSSMIKRCLHDSPSKRPSASDVIATFDSTIKDQNDDYQVYGALNRFDIVKKLQDSTVYETVEKIKVRV